MLSMRAAASRLQPLRAEWVSQLHPDVEMVIGHLHLPFLAWVMEDVNYPNQGYVRKLMRGKFGLGDILPTGVSEKNATKPPCVCRTGRETLEPGTPRCYP